MNFNLAAIESAYGLENLKIISKLGGLTSNNVCVSNENTRFVLKQLAAHSSQLLEKIIAVADMLHQSHIPVPKFMSTLDGQKNFYLDQHYYLLYEQLDGNILHEGNFKKKSLEEAAGMLAKIHQCTAPIFLKLNVCCVSSSLSMCAGHDVKLGGASPLRAELRRSVSLGKGVHREVESEGS
jgi:Ser/Thr protein kinase RdoA (MazF antagonist)